MRWRIAFLFLTSWSGAAWAQPVPPPKPPGAVEMPRGYICHISRQSPYGEIGVQRSLSPVGAPDKPLFSWSTQIGADRLLTLSASWNGPPGGYSDVQLSFDLPGARPRTYRLRIEDLHAPGQASLALDSGPIPAAEGQTTVFTTWSALTGLIAETIAPQFVILADDREIFRSETIDPATFRSARDLAMRLEPELAPLVADYRNRCDFREAQTIRP